MGLRSLPGQATEADEARVLHEWLERHGLRWLHVPNEGKKKRPGVQRGFPDYLILDPPPRHRSSVGTALELKRSCGGSASPDQVEWLLDLARLGWLVKCPQGAGQAIEFLTLAGYDRPPSFWRERRLTAAMV